MPAKLSQISATANHELQALGAVVRAHRKRLGVNATMAAESAGMSRTTWHRIEQGSPAVTIGAYMEALSVLGLIMDVQQVENDATKTEGSKPGSIPTRILLAEYPQLQQLAWHVRGSQTFALSPREALDIYERHGRHMDKAAMSNNEQDLLAALQEIFGGARGI